MTEEPGGPVDIPKPSEGWWQQVPVLNEMYKLLSSTDPVNWELARQVGVALAAEDEPVVDAEAAQAELEAMSRAATVEAEQFSGLVTGTVAPVRTVTRAGWVEANIGAFRMLMDPLADKMSGAGMEGPLPPQASQVLRQISGVLMGLQTGFVMGYLARNVVGQYELSLPSPDGGQLLYVVSNLEGIERDWELDPSQFRYWIALHEVTHHLEFSRPWARAYFHEQLRTLIGSLDFDPTRMQSAFEGLDMLDAERLMETLQDPERLIRAAHTPASSDALARVQAFMTLAEGYATFVMDAVGAKVLNDFGRLKEAMDRRKRSSSPGDVLLERMLGLELKRKQYDDGVSFCRYVAGMRDTAALNHAWDDPASLPTLAELGDPDTWIARVLDG